jgi:hypothetical protein
MMKKLTLILVSLLALGAVKASAWGWDHKLICYVAQNHCTDNTMKVIERYLDVPLHDVGLWMDNFRSRAWVKQDWSDSPEYTMTSLWHAVSVDENFYPLMKSNRPDGNGDGFGALLRCIDILKDYRNQTDSTVVVNLKLVCHLVGDIACPGHILHSFSKEEHDPMGGGLAAGYGKWQYTYNGKSMTLHALIDAVALNTHPEFNRNLQKYAAYLDTCTPEQKREIADQPLDLWLQGLAKDSKQIFEWDRPGAILDQSWYLEHEEYFFRFLRSASYKLADVLNELFDPEYKTL